MIQMNCQGLALGYSSALVRDLSFTVSAGDYLCILGENGVGKSTLMKTVLGLQIPLEGSVTLSGGVHSNEIGYLPQQTQAQRDFPATVWEVVLSGCQSRCGLRPFYTKAEKELDFARYLSDNNIPMWIRQVLIPGYTDDENDLLRLKKFISSLKTVEKVELLPYHNLGEYKWKNLGFKYELENVKEPSQEEIDKAKKILGIS